MLFFCLSVFGLAFLSPLHPLPFGAIFCERKKKKVLSSLERQQKANKPVLKN